MTGRPKSPLSLREMTETEVAWLAGILEGEGSFYVRQLGKSTWLLITVEMSDLDVIEKIQKITGAGNILPRKPKENRKQLFRWTIAAFNNTIALAKLIYPHMSARRKVQLDALLELEVK